MSWFSLKDRKCFIYDELISLSIKLATFQITYFVPKEKDGFFSICLGFPGYEYRCLGSKYHLKDEQLKYPETFIYMDNINMLLMKNRNTIRNPCIHEKYNDKLKELIFKLIFYSNVTWVNDYFFRPWWSRGLDVSHLTSILKHLYLATTQCSSY